MSSENALPIDDTEEPTKGQLLECIRGLQARVERVEEENDDLQEELEKQKNSNVTKTAGNHVLGSLLGVESQDYSSDVFQHKDAAEDVHERFLEIENTVKRHESVIEEEGVASGDTKQKAWKDVVEKAENLSSHKDHALPDNRVLLYSKQIQSATGYSNRRACQLIEEWGEEKQGAGWRPHKRREDSTQKKALKIDLNVWGEDQ